MISFDQIVVMHKDLPISEDAKAASEKQQRILKAYLEEDCSVMFEDWRITRRELFEHLMYGKYAHRNADKQSNVRRLLDHKFAVMFMSDFEDILMTFIEVALWYKSLNERMIEEILAKEGARQVAN